MRCIWQPFWILQEKVVISFYFWIIRLVNSHLALYSHVRCNPLNTPLTPLKYTHMTIINFNYMTITNINYEGSYLPGVICNIVVKAHFGIFTPSNASWDIYYGMYLAATLDSARKKVGISFYFWIIRLVNSKLALYSHVRCNTPPTSPTWQLQILTMTITNFNYEGSYEVGISFYFWIIRLVNTQLALYSHVRCNPLNTHWHPWNTSTWQL